MKQKQRINIKSNGNLCLPLALSSNFDMNASCWPIASNLEGMESQKVQNGGHHCSLFDVLHNPFLIKSCLHKSMVLRVMNEIMLNPKNKVSALVTDKCLPAPDAIAHQLQ